MKVRSTLLYRRSFVATGWQSAVRFSNGDSGSMFRVVKLQTDNGGFVPPYLNVTLSCWDWKSSPKIKSGQSPGITDSLYRCVLCI